MYLERYASWQTHPTTCLLRPQKALHLPPRSTRFSLRHPSIAHRFHMPPPHPHPTYLYKILPSPPPSPLPETLPLSPLDAKDRFIHLSTAAQVSRTAARFFSNTTSLWLLKIPYKGIASNVRWEDGDSGCYAHVYDCGLGTNEVVEQKHVYREVNAGWGDVMGGEEWLE